MTTTTTNHHDPYHPYYHPYHPHHYDWDSAPRVESRGTRHREDR